MIVGFLPSNFTISNNSNNSTDNTNRKKNMLKFNLISITKLIIKILSSSLSINQTKNTVQTAKLFTFTSRLLLTFRINLLWCVVSTTMAMAQSRHIRLNLTFVSHLFYLFVENAPIKPGIPNPLSQNCVFQAILSGPF